VRCLSFALLTRGPSWVRTLDVASVYMCGQKEMAAYNIIYTVSLSLRNRLEFPETPS